jgi:fibronectin type 3 domain-containing protein
MKRLLKAGGPRPSRARRFAHRLRSSSTTRTTFERLELRRMLFADVSTIYGPVNLFAHATDVLVGDPPATVVVNDHPSSWYRPTGRVTFDQKDSLSALTAAGAEEDPGLTVGNSALLDPISFSTNAAGLPLLTSRSDGQGLKVFLDFDGYNTDGPFDTDSNPATFNASEQAVIYSAWRDIVSFFSMVNVNVTTIQPPTGGSNPAFVWQRIIATTSSVGAAFVGAINNSSSQGYNPSGDAVSRHSGIAHEIGHQLNLNHQSDYDSSAAKLQEYSSGPDQRHGPIMGVDYAQTVHKWINGRNTNSADSFQDDLATMTAYIASKIGGDGIMPDDFTGTSIATATALSLTDGSFYTAGGIQRMTDLDFFSFTSTGQSFDINIEPTFESGFVPKLELFDSSGTLIAAKDDTVQRNGNDNASEDFTLDLGAGTYYAKISSHGDYGDLGEYAFFASPLPTGWSTTDVRNTTTGRGGYVAYDAATQTFEQGGSGADIWTTTDAFRFTYQVLSGNGSITTRVTSLDITDPNAKAGLMIRESLAHNSKFAMVNFKPSGSQYIYRTTNGGTAASGTASLSLPNWIQLIRNGNTITLRQSTDGVNFTTAGTVTLSSLTSQVYIGMATNSHNTNQLARATFTNVALVGSLGTTPPTFNALPAPANLTGSPVATQTTGMTLNWTDVAGETGYAIERSVDNVTWSQVGTAAADVATYTDDPGFGSMRWWYRVTALNASGKSVYSNVVSIVNKPRAPSGQLAAVISASKLALSWLDVSGDTGYRVERSSNGGANYTTLATTATNINTYNSTGLTAGTTYTYRITPTSAAGDGVPLVFTATSALPTVTNFAFTSKSSTSLAMSWTDTAGETGYKLERSTDNVTWTTIATPAANATSYTDSTVSPLTHYYYRISGTFGAISSATFATILTATPPTTPSGSPWIDADIGAPAGGGAGFISGRNATVLGGGANIATTSDQFNFLYQPLSGDGDIIAHVTSFDGTNTLAKAGVMIRSSLAVNAPFVDVVFQPETTDFMYRTTTASNSTEVNGPDTGADWVRVVRSGSTFTGYYSATGAAGSWISLGSTSVGMGTNVFIGLVVSARDNTLLAKATFDHVTINTPGNTAPTIVNAASASPTAVTGTFTNVSALGADNAGEANLVYSWSAIGPAPVSFSNNETNLGKNSVATFSQVGTYNLTVTITDTGNRSVTSSVAVTVQSTLNGIAGVSSSMLAGSGQQISVVDQFGQPIAAGSVSWSASIGAITADGFYIAPVTGASSTVITGMLNSTSYNTTIAIASPRAWYKNETTTSGFVADSSGNGYNGTLTTTFLLSEGQIGNSVRLTNGYASLPGAIVNGLTDFTISTWVNIDTLSTWSRIFDFGSSTNVNMFLTPRATDANGKVRFAITNQGGAAEQRIDGTAALPTGVWTQVAVTLAGTVGTLYVNGVAVGTNANLTLKPATLGSFTANYLGKSQYPDPAFLGSIDDFRVYSSAISAAGIAELYASGDAVATSSPGNVTASAQSPNQVNVVWSDNSTAETGYLLQRATNSTFTAGLVNIPLPMNTASYDDISVSPNATYFYRVTTLLPTGNTAGPITSPAVTTSQNVAPTFATLPQSTLTAATNDSAALLAALGSDDAGEANLTYTWSATVLPAGAASPTFDANGTNAAKDTTATFVTPGDYTVQVIATDAGGLQTVATVNVTIAQVAGDFNRDGRRTSSDIIGFMLALTDLDGYQSANGLDANAMLATADLNGDFAVTNADIQSLLALVAQDELGSGSTAVAQVPPTQLVTQQPAQQLQLAQKPRINTAVPVNLVGPTRAPRPVFTKLQDQLLASTADFRTRRLTLAQ